MRKLLLTTTLIAATAVSTNAWSFGGLGILGHKSSHKGGVNAIGVHIDTENKEQPNIDIRSCDSETEELVGSECCKKTLIYTDNDTTKCCSTEGYAVQDGKCKKQCGWGWTLNEESNECECPEERRCILKFSCNIRFPPTLLFHYRKNEYQYSVVPCFPHQYARRWR